MAYLQSPLVMNCVCMDFTSFTGFLVIPAVPYCFESCEGKAFKKSKLEKNNSHVSKKALRMIFRPNHQEQSSSFA